MRIFLTTLYLSLIFLVLMGCNYNYYLGTKLESEERFEEAYEEYQNAYVNSPFSTKYQERRNATAIKTAAALEKRYWRSLEDNQYDYAYFLLNRSLSLNPQNESLQQERKQWYKALLIGNIQFQTQEIQTKTLKRSNVSIVIDFLSNKSNQQLQTNVNVDTGLFYLETVLYKPTFSLISFYSIQKIGIYSKNDQNPYDVQLDSEKAQTPDFRSLTWQPTESYESLIDLGNVRVEEAQGNFFDVQQTPSPQRVIDFVQKNLPEKPTTSNDRANYWSFGGPVSYRATLAGQKVSIATSEQSIPFLPETIYVNQAAQTLLIDYGSIDLRYFSIFGFWGIKRNFDKELSIKHLNAIFQNILFLPFAQYDSAPLLYQLN